MSEPREGDEGSERPPTTGGGGPTPDDETQALGAGAGRLGELPERVGRYRILGLLGEGGMGTVLLAEQETPRRRVALKLLRPGRLGAKALRRFQLEAELLGRLEHPGIARVFEAGRADLPGGPQPFLSMELVEGVALDRYVEERRPSVEERVELVARIADAVQHAHVRGVVHRDLKPANILVQSDGSPKVLDFGVARTTDADLVPATLATQAGEVVGTLHYMSPEQLGGDPSRVDTRSDVWALGVIAYRVLSGRLPAGDRDSSLADVVQAIKEREPPPLAAHDATLAGDLDVIVRTALAKEPRERYQSAAAFASDLRRWRDDEPILARPPSAGAQLRRFVRKHRLVAASLLLAALAIAAGVAATTVGFARATREQARARAAEEAAEAARDEALSSAARSRASADRARAVTAFLVDDILGAADPAVAQGRDLTIREALQRAEERVDRELAGEPEVARAVHETLARLHDELGNHETAAVHVRRALELARGTGAIEREEGLSTHRLAVLHERAQGRLDEASRLADENVERADRLGVEAALRAEVLMDRAAVRADAGDAAAAEEDLAAAVKLLEEARGASHARTLVARQSLATVAGTLGRPAEAAALLREVVAARSDASGPRHPETLRAQANLALQLTALGRSGEPTLLDEAEELLAAVLEGREQVFGADHEATHHARLLLANLHSARGQWADAHALLQTTAQAQERALGRHHPKTLLTLHELASVTDEMGRLEEAAELQAEVVEQWRDQLGPTNRRTVIALNNLAVIRQRMGDEAAALPVLREIVAAAPEAFPGDEATAAILRGNLGGCLLRLERLAEAERELLGAHAALASSLGEEHARTRTVADQLATLFDARGDADAAERWRERAAAPPAGG